MIFKKLIYIICIFIALLSFTSCEETVVLDLDFESQLVLSSFFDSNSPWAVEVSTSATIFEDSSEITLIEDARVIIYDEDNIELYELYHLENGVYGNGAISPLSAHRYNIKVEVGSKVVTASSYVPEKSILKINQFSVVEDNKDQGIEVDFQIEDKSNLDAYFIWEIVSLELEDENPLLGGDRLSDALISDVQNTSPVSETNDREIIGVGLFGDGTYSAVYNTLKGRKGGRSNSGQKPNFNDNSLILDESFIGSGYDDSIIAFDPNGEDENPIDLGEVIKEDPKFELRVVSISKELFDCYNSVTNRNNGSISLSADNPIYTNVENGLGIFAGFNESIIRF
ncbi:MAG: hypothetical protein ACI9P5_000952 [Saprospiraceae bacterium]|jgi:hypothetical protein